MTKEIFKLQRPVIQLGRLGSENTCDVLIYNEDRSCEGIVAMDFSQVQKLFNSNELKTFWYGTQVPSIKNPKNVQIEFSEPAKWQDW